MKFSALALLALGLLSAPAFANAPVDTYMECSVLGDTVDSYIDVELSASRPLGFIGTIDLGEYQNHHYIAQIGATDWLLQVTDGKGYSLSETSSAAKAFVDLIDPVTDVRFSCEARAGF